MPVPAPKPGKLESYKDWTIGCDNRGRCEAVALLPENDPGRDEPLSMAIARDAGPDAQVSVRAVFDVAYRGAFAFLVDGNRIATANAAGGEAVLHGPQASALALAMARGARMEVRQGSKLMARPSLAGAAAALRYMDASQGRAGTTTALVATGPMGATAVRPAPSGPAIKRVVMPVGTAAPAALWREELASVGKLTGCADEMRETSQPPEQHRLSKSETLILVPCGSGAYNATSVPLIATGIAGRREFRFAPFDYAPGWSEDPKQPMLVNAGFTPEQSRLESYAKARGIGDCGGSEAYVWDGTRFRLVEARAMGECRGARTWITTWTARVTQ